MRVDDLRLMDEITFTLPEAPPEDYLRLVEWWRVASRFMFSAVTLGAANPLTRGDDPVRNLVDFDAPEHVEAEARRALAEGIATISPTFRVDGTLAAQARARARRRMEWLFDMAERGGPAIHPELEPLVAATQAVSDETLRAAGFELGST